MMKPVLDIKLFRKQPDGSCPPWERQRSQKALLWMMEGLCRVNQDQIKLKKPAIPLLYSSGIVYQREDGTEDWQDCYTTVEKKWGDCEDLACYRVAELRVVFKRPASPFLTFMQSADGGFHYHALLWAKGPSGWRLEDPSRKLGMGWEQQFSTLDQKQRDHAYQVMDKVQKRVSPKKLARMKEVG